MQTTAAARNEGEREREFAFSDRDFAHLARLVRERTGIALSEHKRELVYGRLARRLRALGLDSFSAYCSLLDGPGAEAELGVMINAITTNLTGFFREKHHFDCLAREALPQLLRAGSAGRRRLRIWSAGCSSGEEPYSIAMALRAVVPAGACDARILATDIDTDMVERARAGIYSAERAKTIPKEYRRFFTEIAEDRVAMAPELTSLITFKPLNLLEPWPMKGPFDAIFCRNVVIYFDKPTQRVLFDRFAELLSPEGWLFVGHSESLFRVSERFKLVGRTIYRRIT